MPDFIQPAGRPIPVEDLRAPDLIPIVIAGIFVVVLFCVVFKR